MDRYFYSVEMDGDRKVVHLFGNVYYNDVDETETCYRVAEWTFLYITIDELKTMLKNGTFYEYVNERVSYLTDLTEDEAIQTYQEYFGEDKCGKHLYIIDVDEDTPCGDYWF